MSNKEAEIPTDELVSTWRDAFPKPIKNPSFDIVPHMSNLMIREPFIYRVFRKFERIPTEEIPTAAVGYAAGRFALLYNPTFMSQFKPNVVRGILVHEALHVVYRHIIERHREPPLLWNYATDLSINCAIPAKDLPEFGLFPGKALHIEPAEYAKMEPDAKERFDALSKLIADFPVNMSANWYMARLLEHFKEEIEAANQMMEALKAAGVGDMDDHGTWGTGKVDGEESEPGQGEAESQIADANLRETLREAANSAVGGNGWGTIPSHMQGEILASLSTTIPWEQVLRKFEGMTRRATPYNTFKRVNRKQPYGAPGRRRRRTATIALYIDQSGSVDDGALALLAGEMVSLSRRTDFHVYMFDTSVDESSHFKWNKNARFKGIKRTRCGGTDFECVTKHAHENKDKFDAYLVLTDGECYKPSKSKMRRGWVIVPGRSLLFEPDPRDVLIKMEHKKDD